MACVGSGDGVDDRLCLARQQWWRVTTCRTIAWRTLRGTCGRRREGDHEANDRHIATNGQTLEIDHVAAQSTHHPNSCGADVVPPSRPSRLPMPPVTNPRMQTRPQLSVPPRCHPDAACMDHATLDQQRTCVPTLGANFAGRQSHIQPAHHHSATQPSFDQPAWLAPLRHQQGTGQQAS